MTILNGRIVGVNDQEFELRTGGDEEPAGGKIRTASPEAVARFKAYLAQQPEKPALKKPKEQIEMARQRRANEIAVAARAKRAAEMNKQTAPAVKPEEPKEQEKMARQNGLSDEEIIAAHRRYVLESMSFTNLANYVPLSSTVIKYHFKRLGLPYRGNGGRWRVASDLARICEVHGLQFSDIPTESLPLVEPAAKPEKANPVKAIVKETPVMETAVEPVMEAAVTPANGAAMTETEIEDQLRAIQQLMSMIGNVENVRISGTMRIDLHAEVVF